MPNIQTTAKNPYKSVDPASQLSGFQKFLDRIGVTNYAGKAQYTNELNAAQWDAEQAARLDDLRYNSPEEQASRMREAGLNPDIQGVGDYEGVTSGNPMNSPAAVQDELTEPIQSIGRGIFNGLQLAMALKTGVAQARSIDLENAKKEFDLIRESAGTLSGEVHKYGDSKNLGNYASIFKSFGNGRTGRRISKAIGDYFDFLSSSKNFIDKHHYEGMSEAQDARSEFVYGAADPLGAPDDKDFIEAVTEFNRLNLEAEDIARQAGNARNKYLKASDDYGMQIGDYKYNKDYQKEMREFQKKMQAKMNDFYDKLEGKDTWWSKAILMGIMMQNQGLSVPGADLAGDIVRTAVTHRIPVARRR